MFHTLTIRVPSEMVLQNKKTGKLKLVPTLTKSGGIAKRDGHPSIILKKDDYIVHPTVDDGETVDYEDMKKKEIEKKKTDKEFKKDFLKLEKQSSEVQQEFINTHKPTIERHMIGKVTKKRIVMAIVDLYKLVKQNNDHPSHAQMIAWGKKHDIKMKSPDDAVVKEEDKKAPDTKVLKKSEKQTTETKTKKGEYKLDFETKDGKKQLTSSNPSHQKFIDQWEPVIKKYIMTSPTVGRLTAALNGLYKITGKNTKLPFWKDWGSLGVSHSIDTYALQRDLGMFK
jgi:hypothetical protein